MKMYKIPEQKKNICHRTYSKNPAAPPQYQ